MPADTAMAVANTTPWEVNKEDIIEKEKFWNWRNNGEDFVGVISKKD